MLRSLTCGMVGAVVTTPQSHDPKMLMAGILRRNCTAVGEVDHDLLEDLKDFVSEEVKSWPVCQTLDHEEWLSKCKLPLYKKQEMTREYTKFYDTSLSVEDNLKRGIHDPIRDATVFGKAEYLIGEKTLRAINPTSAAFKYIVGPYFHWLEEEIMKTKLSHFFIKGIPVKDRPQHIINVLGRNEPLSKTYTTDYSSFECSFTHDVMENLEMVIYRHCFKNLPVLKYIESLSGLITEHNTHGVYIKHKFFRVETTSLRMSGEMNTSLGNGLSNYFLTKYLVSKIKGGNLRGVFEGDDGLFRYEGPNFPSELATKLGFSLKIQPAQVNTASFCGNIFDLETHTVISDPWYALTGSGFSFNAIGASLKTLDLLTASRGLSLMFQFPNCPVLPTLGQRMFRTACINLGQSEDEVRESVRKYYEKSQRVDWWERNKMLEACSTIPAISVADSTRLLFEQCYQFPISLQLYTEKQLRAGTGWFYSPELLQHMSTAQIPQLDGTSVNYSEWIENYAELQLHTSTPVRHGSLHSLRETLITDTMSWILPRESRSQAYCDLPFEVDHW